MEDQTTPTTPKDDSMDPNHMPAEAEYVELQDDEFADASLPNTFPSGATVEADRRDAVAEHKADEIVPGSNSGDAPGSVSPSVAEAERESTKRGANVKGEGQIMGRPE